MMPQRVIQECKDTISHFGVLPCAFDLSYRASNRLMGGMILVGMTLSPQDLSTSLLEVPAEYQIGFVGKEPLYALAKKEPHELSMEFVDSALARGDRCFGFLDKDTLVSYGWYSKLPTKINDQLSLSFNQRYIYMYKGYTVDGYRGQKLHAIGMAHALLKFVEEGSCGLISYVEANNFRSLRSCERLGYKQFGKVFLARVGKSYRILSTQGCEQYGFKVGPGAVQH